VQRPNTNVRSIPPLYPSLIRDTSVCSLILHPLATWGCLGWRCKPTSSAPSLHSSARGLHAGVSHPQEASPRYHCITSQFSRAESVSVVCASILKSPSHSLLAWSSVGYLAAMLSGLPFRPNPCSHFSSTSAIQPIHSEVLRSDLWDSQLGTDTTQSMSKSKSC
jgi:hypothetical protein